MPLLFPSDVMQSVNPRNVFGIRIDADIPTIDIWTKCETDCVTCSTEI